MTEKIINGKRYRMHFYETDHYGGSRVRSQWMELIDEISEDKVDEVDESNQGEDFEKGYKPGMRLR